MATISRSTDDVTITPSHVVAPLIRQDDAQTIVHRVLGAEAPDITLRPAMLSSGTLSLYFMTAADAEAARLFHRPAATFAIISESDEPSLPAAYVPQGGIRQAQQDVLREQWVLDVPYQEIELQA